MQFQLHHFFCSFGRMKNTLILLIVTFFGLQMNGQDLSVLDSIQAKGSTIQSISSHITQNVVKSGNTEIVEGTLNYVSPDKMAAHFDNGDYFIINENRMKVDIGMFHGRFKLSRNKFMRSMSQIYLYAFQGRCQELAEVNNYDLQLNAEDKFYIVQFTSKKKNFLGLGYKQILFYYEQNSLIINQIVLIDYNDIIETFTISEPQFDMSITENYFEL